jgi:hypothetical protein
MPWMAEIIQLIDNVTRSKNVSKKIGRAVHVHEEKADLYLLW